MINECGTCGTNRGLTSIRLSLRRCQRWEYREEGEIGLLLLALLASIIDLPVISEGAYDEAGKIETPQSTMIAKSDALRRSD